MGLHKFFHQLGMREASEFHLTLVVMVAGLFLLNFATFVMVWQMWKRHRQSLALPRS